MKKRFSGLAMVLLLAACGGGSSSDRDDDGGDEGPGRAEARVASFAADLLEGPLARGSFDDYVLENDLLRVIIQKPGRNWFSMGTYGGNIIDASVRDEDGVFKPDHLEEFITGINIENTANYTEVEVRNNGDDGEAAVICATGPDDLLEYGNISTALAELGGQIPPGADDKDLPLEVETCYSLERDQSWVTIDTTLRNTSSEPLSIFLLEYLSGSGEVEQFQPGAGFGEPPGTTQCPVTSWVSCDDGECDPCNFIAYSGNDGAAGVSYGLIHGESGSTSISVVGINAVAYGISVTDFILGGAEPNYEIAGEGQLTLRRYFALGDGNASSIGDIRNEIFGFASGKVSGVVSVDGEPLAEADVSVFQTLVAAIEPPIRFVAGHSRTDSEGRYRMTLPPGEYEIQAHAEGFLYADEEPRAVTVIEGETRTRNFDLPAPGYLHVDVTELFAAGPAQTSPAKVQLVGFDPSPPLKNNVLGSVTGVFGDNVDDMPFGIVLVEFVDRGGSSNVVPIEPGNYQVVVSRGPRYSVYTEDISIVSGETTEVQADIVRVVDTPQVVSADFHVHSIDSADSEVTRAERVATYLAEGVDFFTPSDHDIRVDFTDTIMQMDVSDLIGTAPSAEITTFDYGHYNSWPTTIDSSLIGGGTVDWGREAQPGMDFPEYGSYGLSPEEIFNDALADPRDNIIQISHIGSFFGPGGLEVDTGQTPPASQVDVTTRRLDPELENAFDDGFQALEVWIGTNGRGGIFGQLLGRNMGDWFNLINQGIVRTAVANSDSHDRRNTHLSTRNLVSSAETDPGELSALADTLASTVAEGRVVGSNGPFMTIGATATIAGQTRTAGLGVGEPLMVSIAGKTNLRLKVEVSTPAWAQIDNVDFYVNNQPELTSAEGEVARYGVCPNYTVSAGDEGWESREVTVINGMPSTTRTEITVSLNIPDIREDTWVVAVAHGSDGISQPMFPAVPEDLAQGSNETLEDLTDGNLGENGMLAYAFTNPVFLDVGGNGWEPPGVNNQACSDTVDP